ncbi:hypothetical protein AVEN_128038-1 [Araneus ventricosus]|uniref:Uncharacterized protein n=1 Tax=Araneus ventricosus TaxID=182803 RepID=A0A4Y2A1B6_ARAVE|nr:hypothetical protein AVEN_128038-1 [Araneus ventricosus]
MLKFIVQRNSISGLSMGMIGEIKNHPLSLNSFSQRDTRFSHLPKSSPPILGRTERNLSNRRLLKSTETVCFRCGWFNPFVTEHRRKKMVWLKGRRQAPGAEVEEVL